MVSLLRVSDRASVRGTHMKHPGEEETKSNPGSDKNSFIGCDEANYVKEVKAWKREREREKSPTTQVALGKKNIPQT